MTANLWIQNFMIGAIVLVCTGYALKHVAPGAWRRGVRALAMRLASLQTWPKLSRWGEQLQAVNARGAQSASACASAGSCSSCGACASAAAAPVAPIVLAPPMSLRR